MCQLLGITKVRTSVMRPQANSVVERFNRTIKTMLSSFCTKQQNLWDQYLPQLLMAYRASPHASTGISPNRMVFGHEVMLPMAAMIGHPESTNNLTGGPYITDLKKKIKVAHDIARENLQTSANYRKRYYDVKSKARVLEPGQAVWLYDTRTKPGVCSKLVPKWKGPFLVQKRIDDLTYLVKQKKTSNAKVYHIDRLLKYHGNALPKWFKSAKL
ncbi:uncharacterized protein LOC128559220 [Mercenaria mercenaria]|uniref:uncharacterized protein LOC128559220 n=1 Tax=Mercenaria mercenaria TaxID=6596 RepID=UPI00234E46E8|nr:uncharacterized protein LOC128559220 [Mercenaria mercenaria]